MLTEEGGPMRSCPCGRTMDNDGDRCGVCVGIDLGVFPESIRKMVKANEEG